MARPQPHAAKTSARPCRRTPPTQPPVAPTTRVRPPGRRRAVRDARAAEVGGELGKERLGHPEEHGAMSTAYVPSRSWRLRRSGGLHDARQPEGLGVGGGGPRPARRGRAVTPRRWRHQARTRSRAGERDEPPARPSATMPTLERRLERRSPRGCPRSARGAAPWRRGSAAGANQRWRQARRSRRAATGGGPQRGVRHQDERASTRPPRTTAPSCGGRTRRPSHRRAGPPAPPGPPRRPRGTRHERRVAQLVGLVRQGHVGDHGAGEGHAWSRTTAGTAPSGATARRRHASAKRSSGPRTARLLVHPPTIWRAAVAGVPSGMELRAYSPSDAGQVVAMNQASVDNLAPMDEAHLARLVALATRHRWWRSMTPSAALPWRWRRGRATTASTTGGSRARRAVLVPRPGGDRESFRRQGWRAFSTTPWRSAPRSSAACAAR